MARLDLQGPVPDLTLKVNVGETLRVRDSNREDLVYSFHTNVDDYTFENDGSQANIITNIGTAGILQPGEKHTWDAGVRPRRGRWSRAKYVPATQNAEAQVIKFSEEETNVEG